MSYRLGTLFSLYLCIILSVALVEAVLYSTTPTGDPLENPVSKSKLRDVSIVLFTNFELSRPEIFQCICAICS
jgi:hypothetical protein